MKTKFLTLILTGTLCMSTFISCGKKDHSTDPEPIDLNQTVVGDTIILKETARQADSLVNSMGVNVHFGFYGTSYDVLYNSVVKPKLLELGMRHVRDGASLTGLSNTRQRELNQLGIGFTFMFDPVYSKLSGKTMEESISEYLKSVAPIMEIAEGSNEYNWRYKNDPNWDVTIRNFTKILYETIKNNPATANIPVIAPSLVMVGGDPAKLGDISQWVDYGNMHPYPGYKEPSYSIFRSPNSNGWNDVKPCFPNKPMICTETGYHTMKQITGHIGVSEKAHGKYMPRLFFDYFNAGVTRTYTYEFIDLSPDNPPTTEQKHFGLLRADGSEKPSFIALKNTIALLSDKGPSFKPGKLDYSLIGKLDSIKHTLLQKRDGSFYLTLWANEVTFNPTLDKDIDNQPHKMTLIINKSIAQITVYQPGYQAKSIANYEGINKINLIVPDEVIILKIVPN